MSAFENAKKFFEACEAPAGWAGCKQYVVENAPFVAQSEPLADVDTVEGYCEWMKDFATITVPGATYDLHSASYDPETRTAVFFATYHAKTHRRRWSGSADGQGDPFPLCLRVDDER